MNLYQCLLHDMGIRDVFHWWSRTPAHVSVNSLEDTIMSDQASEFIEPLASAAKPIACDFHRLNIRPGNRRTHSSLLTKAINAIQDHHVPSEPAARGSTPSIPINNMCSDLRPRSIMSSMSVGLTSDEGTTTSSSHSYTPSSSFDRLRPKSTHSGNIKLEETKMSNKINSVEWLDDEYDDEHPVDHIIVTATDDDKKTPYLETFQNALDPHLVPCPRSITFACNSVNSATTRPRVASNNFSDLHPISSCRIISGATTPAHSPVAQHPRKPTIKFACAGPEAIKAPVRYDVNLDSISPRRPYSNGVLGPLSVDAQSIESKNNTCCRSMTVSKMPQSRPSMSDQTPGSSAATRFHEFAGEEEEVDDWLRRDLDILKSKLTISDTLKKENVIRRLASEVEEEELEDEVDEDCGDDSEEELIECDDEDSELAFDSSDDGNETDNEDGFADSDHSDTEEDFTFRAPGSDRLFSDNKILDYSVNSHHRVASTSSIDSIRRFRGIVMNQSRQISFKKLRPEALELPDSTDFVCGTFDEDRCLEDEYLSLLEARKHARHRLTPQDIDPSFPTSDNDEVKPDKRNSENVKRQTRNHFEPFKNRKFERNQSRNPCLLGNNSPKKLHSPPPPRHRLRSPPPRNLAGNPKRSQLSNLSPSICRSKSESSKSRPIHFTPIAIRSRNTHTKSLPRKASPFCRMIPGSQVNSPDGNNSLNCDTINHACSAINIVKSLQLQRPRCEEKFLKQDCSRNAKEYKIHTEHTSHPKRGAELMREVGLIMAYKAGTSNTYVSSA